MKVYILPDKSLVVPERVGDQNIIGDTMSIVPPNNDVYKDWCHWLIGAGTTPTPINSWPEAQPQEAS